MGIIILNNYWSEQKVYIYLKTCQKDITTTVRLLRPQENLSIRIDSSLSSKLSEDTASETREKCGEFNLLLPSSERLPESSLLLMKQTPEEFSREMLSLGELSDSVYSRITKDNSIMSLVSPSINSWREDSKPSLLKTWPEASITLES